MYFIFQIYGTLRVVMKPLVKIIPLVGGVTVFFLNRPVSKILRVSF